MTPTSAPPAAPVPQAVVVPAAFARCSGCHNASSGAAHKIGPNLFGVFGARAGTRSGYSYSDAMSASALTWNAETLDAFLQAPHDVVPGTRMPAAGVADGQARAAIVAYLQAQR